ncbi:MAG: hypothetical protein CM15mP120_01300 [Pseudomonadota bacterium]|nr:MAG: hypothetical protein CM15mP120_01300 [Pseudomonadota bacterium]
MQTAPGCLSRLLCGSLGGSQITINASNVQARSIGPPGDFKIPQTFSIKSDVITGRKPHATTVVQPDSSVALPPVTPRRDRKIRRGWWV